MEELKALGIRIRTIRTEKGLSIRDLAAMTERNKTQILHIENGEVDPRYTTLLRIAQALEVRVGNIADYEEVSW